MHRVCLCSSTCVHVCVHVCTRVCPCVCTHGSAVGRFSCGCCVCKHRAVGLCAHACAESSGFVCRYVSVHTCVLCVRILSAGCVCVCVGVPCVEELCVRVCVRVCATGHPRGAGALTGHVLSSSFVCSFRAPGSLGASGPRECVWRSVHAAVLIFRGEEPGVESPSTCIGPRAVGQVDAGLAWLLAGPGAGDGAHRGPPTSGCRSRRTWRLAPRPPPGGEAAQHTLSLRSYSPPEPALQRGKRI